MTRQEENKTYYAKNRERLLAKAKNHYHENRDRYIAYNRNYWKTYYLENKERLDARMRGQPRPPKERKQRVVTEKVISEKIVDTKEVKEERPSWFPLPIRIEEGNFLVSFH